MVLAAVLSVGASGDIKQIQSKKNNRCPVKNKNKKKHKKAEC